MEEKKCKYYNKHLETIRKLIDCLYELDGCGAGGCLHILLDDDNADTDSIVFCYKECDKHPEREEAELGKLICNEFLKLSEEERYLILWGYGDFSCDKQDCYYCAISVGEEEAELHKEEKRKKELAERNKKIDEFFETVESDNKNHNVYFLQKTGNFYNVMKYRLVDIEDNYFVLRQYFVGNDIRIPKSEVYFVKQKLIDKINEVIQDGEVIREM